jgi:hypothetical protein
MSCYNWERGTIIIPAKDWAGFRKGLLEAWNKSQLELLEKARRAHAAIKAATKGKRGKKRDEALKAAIERHVGHDHDDLHTLVLTYDREGRAYVLKGSQPKKKDLGLHAVSKDATIRLPDASVYFTNKGRAVTWDVPENNRAREHANEHWFAQELFRRLGRITWTRGSGGKIIGNDEYNRDEGGDYEGGGGNYLVAEYRPKSAAERRAAQQARARGRYDARYGW